MVKVKFIFQQKKYLIVILIFINLFVKSINLKSQKAEDFEFALDLYEEKTEKADFKSVMKENQNELQLIFSGFFLFYKTFFSSQDGNHCVFHPSCSVYTIQSIKKNGVLFGFADGMDRLLRCNRLSPENYERYENTNLFSDPPN